MIWETVPEEFEPKLEVVACYVHYGGRFVVLRRLPHKTHGTLWGLPAGKVSLGESLLAAIRRELREEIGFEARDAQLRYREKLYVRPDSSQTLIVYHTFDLHLDSPHNVVLSDTEHDAFRWTTPQEALGLELIHDLDHCIRRHFRLTDREGS